MKKKILFILLILTITFFSCFSENKNGYKKVNIKENTYYFSNNWSEILKIGKPVLFYKTKILDQKEFISDFYYAIETNNQNFIYLGGFDSTLGFINNKKKSFITRTDVSNNSNFFKNELIGISTELIKDPFVIIGIVKDSNDNCFYETEALEYFYIDEIKQSIIEWFPEL